MSLARLVTRLESLSLGPFLFCTRDGYAAQNPRSVNHAALQSLQLPDPITSITKVCWTPLEAQLTLRAEARYRLPLGTFWGKTLKPFVRASSIFLSGPPPGRYLHAINIFGWRRACPLCFCADTLGCGRCICRLCNVASPRQGRAPESFSCAGDGGYQLAGQFVR